MEALFVYNVSKTYKNNVTALDKVKFTLLQGDFVALLGSNGAGKSTLINILSSLTSKSTGVVKIFGHNLETENFLAKICLGVVPQEYDLPNFEKPYNLLVTQGGFYGLTLRQSRHRAETCLKMVGLWEKRDHIVYMLSGGMKRCLLLARALIHEPRLLILDEPTVGLDIEARHMIWEILKRLNYQGITILLTTHYLEEVELLSRQVIVLQQGRVIANAPTRKLITGLETSVFVLDLEHPIKKIPILENYILRLENHYQLEVRLKKNQSLNNLFIALQNLDISVMSMRNKINRLENFLVTLKCSPQNLT